MRRTSATADQILEALRLAQFPAEAHAWLYEVANGTGWRGQRRFADALVVSCWPSRGVFFAGIEVKVDRRDWLRELHNPEKAEEIRSWCEYWYLAAPPGVVKVSEVPKTWGFFEVAGRTVTLAKEAPKQKPKPLASAFVAAVLRNAAAQHEAARKAGHSAGYELASKTFDADAKAKLEEQLYLAQRAKSDAESELGWLKRDHETLKAKVAAFEKSAGLPDHAISSAAHNMGRSAAGEYYKLALQLSQYPVDQLADALRAAAESLKAVTKVTKGAA